MIDLLTGFVSFIAGVIISGVGVSVILAGVKILYTGLGWVF